MKTGYIILLTVVITAVALYFILLQLGKKQIKKFTQAAANGVAAEIKGLESGNLPPTADTHKKISDLKKNLSDAGFVYQNGRALKVK